MVDLAPFGEDDDEGARLITHPRHIETRRGHRTPVHHLHPCVRRVERDACVEVAYRQGHMGQTAIDHHAPPLDLCFRCCSPWCTGIAKSYPGCLDPLMCTARISERLMMRTTLAPKLGEKSHGETRCSSSRVIALPQSMREKGVEPQATAWTAALLLLVALLPHTSCVLLRTGRATSAHRAGQQGYGWSAPGYGRRRGTAARR